MYFQEERLALEIAQGQSNLTLPGTQVDPLSKQRFTNHLFTSEEEKFYRVRESMLINPTFHDAIYKTMCVIHKYEKIVVIAQC